jgi:hypothetical protein
MKVSIYIDGFNLYYGALRNTPYRWLNILTLSQLLFPNDQIESVKYFTAIVSARPNDLNKSNRQLVFLRALRTLPNVEVILGTFLTHSVRMALASSSPNSPQLVEVIKTEEKGSDVNIAAHLIHDAHNRKFEKAALISNDSDLTEPVRIVTQELLLPVVVVNPHKHRQSVELVKYASSVKQIRAGLLSASLLPPRLVDAHGTITKPPGW